MTAKLKSIYGDRLYLALPNMFFMRLFFHTIRKQPTSIGWMLKDAITNALKQDEIRSYYEFHINRNKILWQNLFKYKFITWLFAVYKRLTTHLLFVFYNDDLEKLKPSGILIWNGFPLRSIILIFVANQLNIPILYLENGYFNNTLQADCIGINANNSLPRTPEFYQNTFIANKPFPSKLAPRTIQPKIHTDSNPLTEFIFVPFQVPYDTQIFYFSSWIKSMHSFYQVLLSVVHNLDNVRFVIKEHPNTPCSIVGQVRTHPRIHFANGDNTEKLVKESKAIVTLNSTVGIEALLHKKITITLADSCYNIKGLVFHAQSTEQLIDLIDRMDTLSNDENLRLAFIKYLYTTYLAHGSLECPTPELIQDLDARISKKDIHSKNIHKINSNL